MEAEQDVFCLTKTAFCCLGCIIHDGYKEKNINYKNNKKDTLDKFDSLLNQFMSKHYAKGVTSPSTQRYDFKNIVITLNYYFEALYYYNIPQEPKYPYSKS